MAAQSGRQGQSLPLTACQRQLRYHQLREQQPELDVQPAVDDPIDAYQFGIVEHGILKYRHADQQYGEPQSEHARLNHLDDAARPERLYLSLLSLQAQESGGQGALVREDLDELYGTTEQLD